MDAAHRVRWAREMAGMSQRRLAKLAGLGDATVRHLESGLSRDMETSTARLIAGVLGGSPAWYLTGEGEAPTEESLLALRATVEGAAE